MRMATWRAGPPHGQHRWSAAGGRLGWRHRSMELHRRESWRRLDPVGVGCRSSAPRRMPAGLAHRPCPGSGRAVRIAMSGRLVPAMWAWAGETRVPPASRVAWDSGRQALGSRPGPLVAANRVRSSHAGHRHHPAGEKTAWAPSERHRAGWSRIRHLGSVVLSPAVRRRRRAHRWASTAERSVPERQHPRRRWSGQCQAPRRDRSRYRRRGLLPTPEAGSTAAEQRRDLVARCVRLLA
jgi:hypothetical protein